MPNFLQRGQRSRYNREGSKVTLLAWARLVKGHVTIGRGHAQFFTVGSKVNRQRGRGHWVCHMDDKLCSFSPCRTRGGEPCVWSRRKFLIPSIFSYYLSSTLSPPSLKSLAPFLPFLPSLPSLSPSLFLHHYQPSPSPFPSPCPFPPPSPPIPLPIPERP